MSRVRCSDTGPELIVRRLLYRMGYRYRLHAKSLPGKPDIVFWSRRKAIFVHGCFWHQHGCQQYRMPKSRRMFWNEKLMANVERDRRNQIDLLEMGWDVWVIWECQLKQISGIQRRATEFLEC